MNLNLNFSVRVHTQTYSQFFKFEIFFPKGWSQKKHRILSRKESKDNHEEGVLHRFLNVKGFNTGYLSVLFFQTWKLTVGMRRKRKRRKERNDKVSMTGTRPIVYNTWMHSIKAWNYIIIFHVVHGCPETCWLCYFVEMFHY